MRNKYSEYRLFWQVCDQPTSRDSSEKNWHPPPPYIQEKADWQYGQLFY